jgi:hypothetical protein
MEDGMSLLIVRTEFANGTTLEMRTSEVSFTEIVNELRLYFQGAGFHPDTVRANLGPYDGQWPLEDEVEQAIDALENGGEDGQGN